MRRRAILASRSLRRLLLGLGAIALLLALVGCSMRIARLWQVADGHGGSEAHAIILTHGMLTWETKNMPGAEPSGAAPILNWQIEPGLTPMFWEHDRWTMFTPVGTHVVAERSVAFSIPLALLGVVCLIVALPWLPRRPGFCDCGHDLTGLRSDRCPECGKPLAVARK